MLALPRFQVRPAARAAATISLAALALFLVAFPPSACSRSDPAKSVVLYSSMDDEILRPLVSAFEKETGARVLVVGDTEATKTTGLVQRLVAERQRPRCDVWWSSEVLGTISLERRGIITAPITTIAFRPRVIAYNGERLAARAVAPPRTLDDLLNEKLAGRVGMARPQFGTTRGHMAALRLQRGAAGYGELVRALRAGGVRLYDGNAAVVRAISRGEIDAGLTDLDDALAGGRNGWNIRFALDQKGTIATPITAALVTGTRAPDAARRLLEMIASAATQLALSRGDAAAIPVRADVARPESLPEGFVPLEIDWHAAADQVDEALAAWNEP